MGSPAYEEDWMEEWERIKKNQIDASEDESGEDLLDDYMAEKEDDPEWMADWKEVLKDADEHEKERQPLSAGAQAVTGVGLGVGNMMQIPKMIKDAGSYYADSIPYGGLLLKGGKDVWDYMNRDPYTEAERPAEEPFSPSLLPGQEARFGDQYDALERMQSEDPQSFMQTFHDIMSSTDDDEFGPQYGGGGLGELSDATASTGRELQKGILDGGEPTGIQEVTSRLTSSLPALGAGTTPYLIAAGSNLAGIPVKKGLQALGVGETLSNVGDIVTSLLSGLAGGAINKALKPIPPVVTKSSNVAKKALSGTSPQQRTAKAAREFKDVSKENINKFEKIADDLPPQKIKGTYNAEEDLELIKDSIKEASLNQVYPEKVPPQRTWSNVQTSLKEKLNTEKKVVNAKYDKAAELSGDVDTHTKQLVKKLKEERKSIAESAKYDKEYAAPLATLDKIITDLEGAPLKSVQKEGGKIALIDPKLKIPSYKVKVNKAIEMAKGLSSDMNWESFSPEKSKRFSQSLKYIKDDIASTLEKTKPEAHKAFVDARESYKIMASNWYDKDVIMNTLSTQLPEDLPKNFLKPSNYEALHQVLPENLLSQVERSLVETMGGKKPEYKELTGMLSKPAQSAIQDISEIGNAKMNTGGRVLIAEKIFESAQQSVLDGKKPQYILDKMTTPEGYDLVKATLSQSENGRKIFNTAQKLFLQDTLASLVTEKGTIDPEKVTKMLKNANMKEVVKAVGGQDAVDLLTNWDKSSKNITRNINTIGKGSDKSSYLTNSNLASKMNKEPEKAGKIASMFNNMKPSDKTALAVLTAYQIGGPSLVATGSAVKILMSLIGSKNAKKMIKQLGSQSISPEGLEQVLRNLQKINLN